jgi:phosphoglycolate phosphatase-like HAD superfamily hydrolase
MKNRCFNALAAAILGLTLGLGWSFPVLAQGDPLPSSNDTPTKQAIVDFVGRVTKAGGPDFVAPAQRIATFDNDGTLWVEQPMYVQMAFALDRMKAMAPLHPEWKYTEPFESLLEGDTKVLAETGERGLVEVVMVTHAGMTSEEFSEIVMDWLATARDRRFKRPYAELVYQPMLELLSYLQANGIKSFMLSGGGVEFIRPWSRLVILLSARTVDRIVDQDQIPNARRDPFAIPVAGRQFHRRQGRQASRNQRGHWPPPNSSIQ